MTLWPLPRAARAAVFAAVCVALAAAAHFGMAPGALPPSVLAAGFAGTAGFTWLLAGRRRGAVATGTWMVTAQGSLHLLFSYAHSHVGGAAAMPGMDMPGMAAMHHPQAAQFDPGMPPGMLVGHLLAALGCALLMRHGEAALAGAFDLVRTLARAVLAFLLPRPVPPSAGPVRRRSVYRAGSPRLLFLSHALVRRGPPRPVPTV